MTREEFMEKGFTTNKEWVQQQIIHLLNRKDEYQIRWALKKLHDTIYKEWARDMTLAELHEALQELRNLE